MTMRTTNAAWAATAPTHDGVAMLIQICPVSFTPVAAGWGGQT
jgi:hypothetical protein